MLQIADAHVLLSLPKDPLTPARAAPVRGLLGPCASPRICGRDRQSCTSYRRWWNRRRSCWSARYCDPPDRPDGDESSPEETPGKEDYSADDASFAVSTLCLLVSGRADPTGKTHLVTEPAAHVAVHRARDPRAALDRFGCVMIRAGQGVLDRHCIVGPRRTLDRRVCRWRTLGDWPEGGSGYVKCPRSSGSGLGFGGRVSVSGSCLQVSQARIRRLKSCHSALLLVLATHIYQAVRGETLAAMCESGGWRGLSAPGTQQHSSFLIHCSLPWSCRI